MSSCFQLFHRESCADYKYNWDLHASIFKVCEIIIYLSMTLQRPCYIPILVDCFFLTKYVQELLAHLHHNVEKPLYRQTTPLLILILTCTWMPQNITLIFKTDCNRTIQLTWFPGIGHPLVVLDLGPLFYSLEINSNKHINFYYGLQTLLDEY